MPFAEMNVVCYPGVKGNHITTLEMVLLFCCQGTYKNGGVEGFQPAKSSTLSPTNRISRVSIIV